jgi:hypothetical protein
MGLVPRPRVCPLGTQPNVALGQFRLHFREVYFELAFDLAHNEAAA